MEKVRIPFYPLEKKVIKFNGFRFTVIPYLDLEDVFVASQNCINEFFRISDKDQSQYALFPAIKLAFDAVVINQCTNINLDGVEWSDIIRSGIMQKIRKEIINYDSAWAEVLEGIRLQNVYVGLHTITETLPNEEEMKQNIKDTTEMISQLNKDDPQTLKKMIKTVAMTQGIEQIRAEAKAEVKEKVKKGELEDPKKTVEKVVEKHKKSEQIHFS